MSLAAEWKGAPGRLERDPSGPLRDPHRRESERRVPAERKNAQASRRRKLVFVCFISVAAFICGILILSVFMHVMVAQNEVKLRQVQQQIDGEKRQQEAIKLDIATLESPARIEKIAIEKFQMIRVPLAAYVQTEAYKAARASERQKLSSKEAAAGGATQGG
jgi:cell division protein FtsL